MIWFIAGLFVGFFLGIFVMVLAVTSKYSGIRAGVTPDCVPPANGRTVPRSDVKQTPAGLEGKRRMA